MALCAERQDESPSVRARRKTEATSGGSACLRGPMQTRVPGKGASKTRCGSDSPTSQARLRTSSRSWCGDSSDFMYYDGIDSETFKISV